MKAHRGPPGRLHSLIIVLVIALVLVGILQGVNLLRHPLPDDMPAVPELDDPAADPRTEIVCEDPRPIEGAEREDDDSPVPIEGELVTSNDLLDCPQTYHEQVVRYQGEVVGAVLRREDGAWVQLNDDVYGLPLGPLPAHRDYRGGNAGLGVLIPLDLAEEIGVIGGPSFRGDVVEIIGEFRRVDSERREAAVIIAHEGEVVASGRPIEDPVLPDRRVAAVVLGLLAIAVAVGERLLARRR